MRRQSQRGFTLLEIMVVIVIMGILASLVVPNLMGNKDKADRQKVVSDIVALGNDSNLLIVFYVQIMPDDFIMQLHRF